MSNQVILWSTLIVPWLSLLFMPKETVKRYMPVGFFSLIMSIITSDIGVANGWWYFPGTTYPFATFPHFFYGFYPIAPIWIFSLTYGRFWRFFLVEIFANAVFSFIILSWFADRGFINIPSKFLAFTLETLVATMLYGFQMWQEGVFEHLTALRPTAYKYLPKDPKDKDDE